MMFALLLFQIGDQHAELRAPVANVVGADHFMTEKFKGAGRRIADDCRAHMAYMHLLRHVWRG